MVKAPKTKKIDGKMFKLVGTGFKGTMEDYARHGPTNRISTRVVKVGDTYALYIRPYGGW
jgi:hypothetical protein